MIRTETHLFFFCRLAVVGIAVVLTSLAGCATDDPPNTGGGQGGSPPWSEIVGPDYAHKAVCAKTIEDQLNLDLPGLPSPPAAVDNLSCAWDVFAWNSFAALNWPANTELGKRGIAEGGGASFVGNKDHGAELVWEAFKEKRELFQDDFAPRWNDLEGGKEVVRFKRPSNLWDSYGGYCSLEDQNRAGTTASGPFALDKFHNQLDETAEVQSQALENLDELCNGHGKPPCGVTNQSVVGPRVWQGNAVDGRPIYYEVKVNYDFFKYVVQPSPKLLTTNDTQTLVSDEVAATNAMLGLIALPWRSASATANGPNPNRVLNYTYPKPPPGQATPCDPTTGEPDPAAIGSSDPAEFVPCKVGAVHMKSAWLKLEPAEIAANCSDPTSTCYHTTTALYYRDAGLASVEQAADDVGKSCIAVDTFGLLGLHAIQRVKTPTADNPGGAFVFATWEHRSIYDSKVDPPYDQGRDFQYVNLKVATFSGDVAEGAYPTREHALPVTRMIPAGKHDEPGRTTCGLSAQQTCQVNTAVRKKLEGSMWSNYRLVGTQFAPTNCDLDETGDVQAQLEQCRKNSLAHYGQPHFLANTVIETNQGLQHFLGLPPGQPRLQPSQWCQDSTVNKAYCDNQGARLVGPNPDLQIFHRGMKNVVFNNNDGLGKKAINMGGCQGCHGVAQQNGYSFSFVLLDGQGGAGADTQNDAKIPATSLSESLPLKLVSVLYPSKGLATEGPADKRGYYKVVLKDLDEADRWVLQPFSGAPETGNPAGQIVVYNKKTRGLLTQGVARGGVSQPVGEPSSVLVGPPVSVGTSRVAAAQQVFLVGYKGPTHQGAPKHRYGLLSVLSNEIENPAGSSLPTISVHYTLTVEDGGSTTATPPAPIPEGTPTDGEKAALERQAFSLMFVDPEIIG